MYILKLESTRPRSKAQNSESYVHQAVIDFFFFFFRFFSILLSSSAVPTSFAYQVHGLRHDDAAGPGHNTWQKRPATWQIMEGTLRGILGIFPVGRWSTGAASPRSWMKPRHHLALLVQQYGSVYSCGNPWKIEKRNPWKNRGPTKFQYGRTSTRPLIYLYTLELRILKFRNLRIRSSKV